MLRFLGGTILMIIANFYAYSQQGDTPVMDKNYTSDTIRSFVADTLEQDVWNSQGMPDSSDILARDTVNHIMIFIHGSAYIGWYDETNIKNWPDTNSWVTWPLFGRENVGYIDREFGDRFYVTMHFIIVSGKRLLQINWEHSTNGNRVWTTQGGTQLWDLKTKTCYFDFDTYEDVEASGAGTETGEGWREHCDVQLKAKNNKLIISNNTCGKYPKPGKYTIAGNNLVRKK